MSYKEIFYPKRALKIFWNEEKKEWLLDLKGIEYPCDIESVKNFYAIESCYMNISRREDINISDVELKLIKLRGKENFKIFSDLYPRNIFETVPYFANIDYFPI